MIVFFGTGRFGNQIFQYCGLKKLFPDEKIVFVGMHGLRKNLEGIDVHRWVGADNLIHNAGILAAKLIFRFLSKRLRLFSFLAEDMTDDGYSCTISKGLFDKLCFGEHVYFQFTALIDEAIASPLTVGRELQARAESLCSKLPTDPATRFFVHVRRGDYTTWPAHAPAALPIDWYRSQMDAIRQRHDKAFFIVVSDDKPYVRKELGGRGDVYLSDGSEGVDFALMTLCHGGGILSASSFSWWATYFIRKTRPDAFFVAPLYWAGHRQRRWLGEGMRADWIRYAGT